MRAQHVLGKKGERSGKGFEEMKYIRWYKNPNNMIG
jgi:hypothetical protein